MLFYGMIVWILFVIAVWGVGMVRILFFEEDRKHRTLKKTLLKISKWTLKLFGVFLAVAVIGSMAFSYKYQKECGPDPEDVKVMKPMAKAISDYIVKHGIPRSLSEIPNLPYKLEGCKREEYYQNTNNFPHTYDHVPKEKANLHQIEETCHFKNMYLELGVTDHMDNTRIGGMIKMVSTNKTVLTFHFRTRDGKNYLSDKIKVSSSKSTGICNPMKQ